MQNLPEEETQDQSSENKEAVEPTTPQPHKHNPFEDKKDSLTKEEEEAIEQFKEAQTERD